LNGKKLTNEQKKTLPIGLVNILDEIANSLKEVDIKINIIKDNITINSSTTIFTVESLVKEDQQLKILDHMKLLNDYISYKSRTDIINELERVIQTRIDCSKLSGQNQYPNGLGRMILGLRGIGKSFLLQQIAIYLGLNFPSLLVVYINVEYTIKFSLLDILIFVARKHFDNNYNPKDFSILISDLRKKNLTLVIFIDELQFLY